VYKVRLEVEALEKPEEAQGGRGVEDRGCQEPAVRESRAAVFKDLQELPRCALLLT
jgi:hypothetical protein